jgi:hypothetical protein
MRVSRNGYKAQGSGGSTLAKALQVGQERSTGPKTAEGRARVSRNAHNGGVRATLRKLSKLLRDQDKKLRNI